MGGSDIQRVASALLKQQQEPSHKLQQITLGKENEPHQEENSSKPK